MSRLPNPVTPKEAARRTKAIKTAGYNVRQASRDLGVSQATLNRWWHREQGTTPGGIVDSKPAKSPKVEKAVSDEIKRLTAERDQAVEQLQATRAAKVDIIRPGKVRAKLKGDITRVIIPDSHGASIDPDAAAAFLADLKRLDPEQIIMLGDHLDCGGFLAAHHVLGFVAETSLTYAQDVKACNLFLDQIQKAAPRAKIDYLSGNHECNSLDTDILTPSGWVKCNDLNVGDALLTYAPGSDTIVRASVVAKAVDETAPLVSVKGDCSDELVSITHRVLVDDKLVPVRELVGQQIRADRMRYAGSYSECPGLPYDDDFIRLLVWTVCDGCIWHKSPTSCRVQFKLSLPEKIERLKALLDRLGVPYTHGPATKCGVNKLQPFWFRIYGETAKKIHLALGAHKTFNQEWQKLNRAQLTCVLEELEATDGSRAYQHIVWRSTDLESIENIQLACVFNGVVASATDLGFNRSGFTKNCKQQWRLNVFDRGVSARRYVYITEAGTGTVVALQSTTGALITRRNGCVAFTGNCRVEKWCINETFKSGEDATFLLSVFGPEAVLNLKQRGIRYIHAGTRYDDLPVPGMIRHGKCHFTHGFACGKHAADTHMARAGTSIVFGHIHRSQSVISRTVHAGTVGAWSPGCLSKLQPFYMNTNPTDWSHGYAAQFVAPSEKFIHVQVPILDGESMLLGSLSGK